MYGLVYFLLQKYVHRKFGPEGWTKAFENAGIPKQVFAPNTAYPDESIVALIGSLCKSTGQPLETVLRDFGQAIAPDLLAMHPTLIRKEWRTLDVIENTESVIHSLIRKTEKGATPPSLQCVRNSENELQLIYSSARKLCPLAMGICEGVAKTFGESLEIQESSCMHKGDHFCCMTIRVQQNQIAGGLNNTQTDLSSTHETLSNGSHDELDIAQLKNFFGAPELPEELARLANFSIIKLIGSGGMGLVFEVLDLQTNSMKALKIIRPGLLLNDEHRLRFLREARSLAELDSPYIVAVEHVGTFKGLPYYTMPILDGCTLDEWFRQSQKVTFGFLYMLGNHLAKGLKATHDKGLVHRDIKPSNIWISGNGMSAKIMDFGLVLDTNETQRFTRVGVLMGTVHFMSPEQMNDGPVDARADLYCMGLILYLCCTGRLPYGQLSFLQMIKALFFVKIVPPHEQNSTVPLKVSECIMRLLDVKPETRLGNSSDFIQAWEDAFAALGRDSSANQECVYRGHFLDETATPTGAWELK